MFDIVSKLRQSPAVRHLHVIDLIDEASAKYLRCRVDLVDGSTPHISESSIAGSSKYSYH